MKSINKSTFSTEDLIHELVDNRKCAVVTGAAGTGKSFVIRKLQEVYGEMELLTCAPTGTAAKNIEGLTIHKLFGIGRFRKVKKPNPYSEELRRASVLIIDECSMLSASLFSLVNKILIHERQNDAPFGGMKVILFGDMRQLKPVPEARLRDDMAPDISFYNMELFRNRGVISSLFNFYELKTNHRQEKDDSFQKVLNCLRNGKITAEVVAKLNENYSDELTFDEQYRYLTSTNKMAAYINSVMLRHVEGEVFSCKRQIFYKKSKEEIEEKYGDYQNLIGEENIPKIVLLKKGATILFYKNDTSSNLRWTNGQRGKVMELVFDGLGNISSVIVALEREGKINEKDIVQVKKEAFPFYGFSEIGEYFELGKIKQWPFTLGFSHTIDKAQGMTLGKIAVVFSGGRARANLVYVAASRVRKGEDFHLEGSYISKEDIITNSEYEKFISDNNLYVRNVY